MIKGQLIWDTKNLEECKIVFRKNVFKRKYDLLVENVEAGEKPDNCWNYKLLQWMKWKF